VYDPAPTSRTWRSGDDDPAVRRLCRRPGADHSRGLVALQLRSLLIGNRRHMKRGVGVSPMPRLVHPGTPDAGSAEALSLEGSTWRRRPRRKPKAANRRERGGNTGELRGEPRSRPGQANIRGTATRRRTPDSHRNRREVSRAQDPPVPGTTGRTHPALPASPPPPCAEPQRMRNIASAAASPRTTGPTAHHLVLHSLRLLTTSRG